MRRIVMVTLAVLPWVLAVGLAVTVALGFFHMRKQDAAMHGMAGAIMHVGALAIEQDKRIDGYDSVLPSIFRTDNGLVDSTARLTNEVALLQKDVQGLREDVDRLKSSWQAPKFWYDPMPNPAFTNWFFGLTNFNIGTNMFFYVTVPCTADDGIMGK